MTVPVWVVGLLLVLTGAVGVLSGFLGHWWLELRALRPAYRAAIRGDRLTG
jgi:hypothetical protein